MNRTYTILLLLALTLASLTSTSAEALSERTSTRSTAITPTVTLPRRDGSVKILVFGDTGRGSNDQYELGGVMTTYRQAFPFDTVLMTGDNIYGTDKAEDMKKKFEDVYRPLLDRGVSSTLRSAITTLQTGASIRSST